MKTRDQTKSLHSISFLTKVSFFRIRRLGKNAVASETLLTTSRSLVKKYQQELLR